MEEPYYSSNTERVIWGYEHKHLTRNQTIVTRCLLEIWRSSNAPGRVPKSGVVRNQTSVDILTDSYANNKLVSQNTGCMVGHQVGTQQLCNSQSVEWWPRRSSLLRGSLPGLGPLPLEKVPRYRQWTSFLRRGCPGGKVLQVQASFLRTSSPGLGDPSRSEAARSLPLGQGW